MSDPINNPPHYKVGSLGMEAIEIIDNHVDGIKDGREAVYSANVLKYVLRYRLKDGVKSLKKARWYLDRQIEYMEERNKSYGNYTRHNQTKVVANEEMVKQMDQSQGRET